MTGSAVVTTRLSRATMNRAIEVMAKVHDGGGSGPGHRVGSLLS